MKIGLVFPNKDRRYKTIHMGLAYLASYARKQHIDLEITVLDTRVATKKETKAFFGTSFDLVGITVFFSVYDEVKDIFQKVRKNFPNTPICLGGPYVTTLMDEIFLETPADFAVYGEGEVTFAELIDHLKGKCSKESIHGLMYSRNNGQYAVNQAREQIQDLDELPQPAYDLFKMKRYPLHRLVTSRGCPYACSWCNSTSIWGSRWRSRSAEEVVREIEMVIEKYGKKTFAFNDNSFNIDSKYVEEFCDLLISKNLKILWSTPVRIEKITPKIAMKMKTAGCYNISVGIESASNSILNKMNKQTSIEELQQGIKVCKEAGIDVLGQFVIGSPGETLEDVHKSVSFAKTSGLDYVNFYTVLPFKGTPQWEYVKEHGTLFSEKIHDYPSEKPRIVFDTPEFPYHDRLKAIRMAKKAGYYSNKDKKNWMFDLAKHLSQKSQEILPESLYVRIYMLLKGIYKLNFVRKNNI
jgi:radical SAM superfamily enzyme YgiQ (UPF0313 family)